MSPYVAGLPFSVRATGDGRDSRVAGFERTARTDVQQLPDRVRQATNVGAQRSQALRAALSGDRFTVGIDPHEMLELTVSRAVFTLDAVRPSGRAASRWRGWRWSRRHGYRLAVSEPTSQLRFDKIADW